MPLAEIYICLNITAEPITGGDAECNLLRYAVVKWGRFQNMTFSVPYRFGPVNSNMVNSKFHLIQTFFKISATFLSFQC